MEHLKERLWLSFYVLFSFTLGVFIVIFGLVFPFWGEIDGFLYVLALKPWKFSVILITSAVCTFIYTIYLIRKFKFKFKNFPTDKKNGEVIRKWGYFLVFRFLPIPLFLFWILCLLVLFIMGSDHIILVGYHLELLSPFIFFGIVIFLSLLFKRVYRYIDNNSQYRKHANNANNANNENRTHYQKKTKTLLIVSLISFAYIAAFAFPLIYPPSTIANNPNNLIPDKPIIIAHRGAAYLAPENTLPAVILAAELGAEGWEVDVRMSKDGYFYLMHDDSLLRTTNVADIFPERKNDDGETFLFSELRQLDAGSWFVERDPFNAILFGKISKADAENYRSEKIPSLDEILNLTIHYDLLIDIDMKKPDPTHPFYEEYESLLLTKLQESALGKKIIIKSTLEQAENMTRLVSYNDISLENLSETDIEAIDIIDEKYSISNKDFKIYKENNIPIMAGVLDSTWRFSQLWMMGVEIVLTDIPDVFIQMSRPILSISRPIYSVVWMTFTFLLYGYAILKNRKPRSEKIKSD